MHCLLHSFYFITTLKVEGFIVSDALPPLWRTSCPKFAPTTMIADRASINI